MAAAGGAAEPARAAVVGADDAATGGQAPAQSPSAADWEAFRAAERKLLEERAAFEAQCSEEMSLIEGWFTKVEQREKEVAEREKTHVRSAPSSSVWLNCSAWCLHIRATRVLVGFRSVSSSHGTVARCAS